MTQMLLGDDFKPICGLASLCKYACPLDYMLQHASLVDPVLLQFVTVNHTSVCDALALALT